MSKHNKYPHFSDEAIRYLNQVYPARPADELLQMSEFERIKHLSARSVVDHIVHVRETNDKENKESV